MASLRDLLTSTQQSSDFVDGFDDFPVMDASVEQLLGEAKVAGSVPTTVVQSSTLCSNPPPLVPVPCPTVSSGHVYGSPKSEKAVSRAIASGIPVKTKLQTNWTVRTVWEQWARNRNSRLLPG